MLKSSLFWIVILSIAILAACTNSDSDSEEDTSETTSPSTSEGTTTDDEKVSIEFWHAMSGSGQESLDSIVKGFNDSQDKYEVIAEFQGTYEESLTKLRGVGGTKDAPAIT